MADEKTLDGRPSAILVVEDCPEDRIASSANPSTPEAISNSLWPKPSQVKKDLRHCRTETPDCVLLDYLLPDLNGLEFMDELFGTSRQHALPRSDADRAW